MISRKVYCLRLGKDMPINSCKSAQSRGSCRHVAKCPEKDQPKQSSKPYDHDHHCYCYIRKKIMDIRVCARLQVQRGCYNQEKCSYKRGTSSQTGRKPPLPIGPDDDILQKIGYALHKAADAFWMAIREIEINK